MAVNKSYGGLIRNSDADGGGTWDTISSGANSVLDPGGFFETNTVEYEGIGFDPDMQEYGYDWMGEFDQRADSIMGRQIDPAAYQMLLAQANGTAPSAAQMQMMAGLQRSQAMAQSMAASNPSVSPALAQRMAGQQMTDMGLQTNQQAAILRAQEQAAGQQAFAQYGISQQALNDAMAQYYMQQGFSRDEAEFMAAKEVAIAEADQQLRADQGNAGQMSDEKGGKMGFIGSIFAGLSDERLKTDIDDADEGAAELLAAISAKTFRYKNEEHGDGEYLGFMAQDLEKSALGRTMVFETDEGKAVDLQRVSMASLALAAHLDKRVRELEAR